MNIQNMKIYSNSAAVIIDLHKKGFTNDFQLFGNDLFWVQEGIFLRAGEFVIVEYHKIELPENCKEEEIVFGVTAPYHHIKGILLNHYKSYTEGTPPVLIRKLNELKQQVEVNAPTLLIRYDSDDNNIIEK